MLGGGLVEGPGDGAFGEAFGERFGRAVLFLVEGEGGGEVLEGAEALNEEATIFMLALGVGNALLEFEVGDDGFGLPMGT